MCEFTLLYSAFQQQQRVYLSAAPLSGPADMSGLFRKASRSLPAFRIWRTAIFLGATKFFIQLCQLLKSAAAELSSLGNTVQKRFYLAVTFVSVTKLLKHWIFLGYRNAFSYPFQEFMLLRWLLVGPGKFSNESWHSGDKGQELWATRMWAEGWKSSFTISDK